MGYSRGFRELLIDPQGNGWVKRSRNSALEAVPGDLSTHVDEIQSQVEHARQDGEALTNHRLALEIGHYRVSLAPTIEGDWTIVRPMPAQVPALAETGLNGTLREMLMGYPEGLVLIAGAMGEGKTTTAAALVLEVLRRYGGHAVTVEMPPEMPLHGWIDGALCLQCETRYESGVSTLGWVLRQGAPEVVLIGEIRGPESAEQAIHAAMLGHLIVATIHADGIGSALERLALYAHGLPRDRIWPILAEGVTGVIHQRLVERAGGVGMKPQAGALFLQQPRRGAGMDALTDEVTQGARNAIRDRAVHQLDTFIRQQRALLGQWGKTNAEAR